MKLVDELRARGFIEQMTYPEELEEKLNDGKLTFYAGFDCTADSLTVGHYLLICLFKHLQKHGHKMARMMMTPPMEGTPIFFTPNGSMLASR